MTGTPIPETVAAFAQELGPEADEVIREMDERAEREDFPTVGPALGGWLALLIDLVGARRVYEFGSGFGYSAYWMARQLPPDGVVHLTEVDESELEDARAYFTDGGLTDRAAFHPGDAIDIVDQVDGPFEVVLIDNEKDRYIEAFEAVRPAVAPGGLVVADNTLAAGTIDLAAIRALLAGKSAPTASEASAGIAAYLDRVRRDEAFETVLLPLGEGMTVSRRSPQ